MDSLAEKLQDTKVLRIIRIFAVGSKNDECFENRVRVKNEERTYDLFFEQYAKLNTWGQGDIKVSIDKETAKLFVYRKDVDGENWSKSRYVPTNKEIVTLEELLENFQSYFKVKEWIES